MIWVDDPVAQVAKISERGLKPVDIEKHDTGLAEPVGGLYSLPSVNGGQKLVVDRHI